MALCRYPKFTTAIGTYRRETRMGFNISLVGLLCFVTAFHHDISFMQPCFHITMTKLIMTRFVTGLSVLLVGWLNQRRTLLQRFVDICYVRQLFISDLDKF